MLVANRPSMQPTAAPLTVAPLARTRTDLFNLAVIALAVVVIVWRLWQPGIPNRADFLMGVYRLFELVEAWRYGIFYPRLGPDLNFSYGAPLFQFYPPLVSYIGLGFYGLGLGFLNGSKAILTLIVLVSGVGMYVYARAVLEHRPAALLSALLYQSAPYLLLDVYERGAMAEGLALALLPWLFWSLRGVIFAGSLRMTLGAAVLIAAVTLAHNITAFFALPVALGYAGLLAVWARRWPAMRTLGLAVLLGLGLCAFYWLPALREVRFTRAEEYMLNGATAVENNVVPWYELVQPTLLVEYQGPLRFRYALLPLFIGGLGLAVALGRRHRLRFELGLLGLLWLAILFFQLDVTLPFWLNVPMVQFIQFSWRLYGLAALCVAMLGGALLLPVRHQGLALVLALAVGGVSMALNLYNLDPQRLPYWYDLTEAQFGKLDLYARGRLDYPLFGDYSPVNMRINPGSLSMPRPPDQDRLPPVVSAPVLRVIDETPVHIRLDVQAPEAFPLRFHRIYFPGWQVYVDGRPTATGPSGQPGLVTAELPSGAYQVELRFDQTPVRQVADLLSLVGLAILIGLLLAPQRNRQTVWVILLLCGLLVAASLTVQRWAKWGNVPTTLPVNFQDELHLVGYKLPRTVWGATDEIPVRLYWWVQQAPVADYKVFLHVALLDDTGKVAQADSQPMLGYSPTSRWEAGELVIDEYRLVLEEPVAPGRYRLLMGVYDGATMHNLFVQQAPTVLPGDRVILTEVEIVE